MEHFLVGIEDGMTLGIVTETYGERETELALLGLVELASLEANAHEVKLGFGHGSLQSEYQAIVEVRQIIHRIGVIDQCLIETAELKQLLEVGIVAGQP